jgi:hypothetical protein
MAVRMCGRVGMFSPTKRPPPGFAGSGARINTVIPSPLAFFMDSMGRLTGNSMSLAPVGTGHIDPAPGSAGVFIYRFPVWQGSPLNHSTRHSPDATGPNPIVIGFEAGSRASLASGCTSANRTRPSCDHPALFARHASSRLGNMQPSRFFAMPTGCGKGQELRLPQPFTFPARPGQSG